jgi:hypothetical protein
MEKNLFRKQPSPTPGKPLFRLLPADHPSGEILGGKREGLGVEAIEDAGDRADRANDEPDAQSRHLLDSRKRLMLERIRDREGHLPLLPGDGDRHVFSCNFLGKDLGEGKRHSARFYLEERDPQRFRQDPSPRVGVEVAGEKRRLHGRNSLTVAAHLQVLERFGG